jgi:predicted nucleic acid-binding protein
VTVALDSWAVLRYLEDAPPAASAVARLLRRERPVMSWVNLGEVFYVVRRAAGEGEAAAVVRDLRTQVDAELPTTELVLAAGRIKSEHAMALADAYAAATAATHDATLWTGDPELLLAGAGWRWRDLRTGPALAP